MTGQQNYNDPERDRLMEFLGAHTAKLSEHFTSVQIVATRDAGQNTEVFSTGSGNYYARLGSVQEWLWKEKEQSLLEKREDFEAGEED